MMEYEIIKQEVSIVKLEELPWGEMDKSVEELLKNPELNNGRLIIIMGDIPKDRVLICYGYADEKEVTV